MAIIVAV